MLALAVPFPLGPSRAAMASGVKPQPQTWHLSLLMGDQLY